MPVRTLLLAALAVAGASSMPLAAAAAPQVTASTDHAIDAANMAVLDRFYLALGADDAATIAELLAGAMIWNGGEGARFAAPASRAAADAVLEGVFGPGVARLEDFSARADLYIASGRHVVALGQYTAVNRSTGALLKPGFSHVFTFSEGRIVGFQQYTDTPRWTEGTALD